jgi:hypothetical protein
LLSYGERFAKIRGADLIELGARRNPAQEGS